MYIFSLLSFQRLFLRILVTSI
uniref:Uncharacterized protein n=1 Tax=Rhizophora mucronata TaxID=61149 RepID=A0A2P2N5C2_RHIMU